MFDVGFWGVGPGGKQGVGLLGHTHAQTLMCIPGEGPSESGFVYSLITRDDSRKTIRVGWILG